MNEGTTTQLLDRPAVNAKPRPRLCHLANQETGMSYCGARSFVGHEAELHSKEVCKAEHQICVVCVAMVEARGRFW